MSPFLGGKAPPASGPLLSLQHPWIPFGVRSPFLKGCKTGGPGSERCGDPFCPAAMEECVSVRKFPIKNTLNWEAGLVCFVRGPLGSFGFGGHFAYRVFPQNIDPCGCFLGSWNQPPTDAKGWPYSALAVTLSLSEHLVIAWHGISASTCL